ncbi:hypothetical protein EDB81DRAFT_652714 [Dactylonectria macrodidyma]|uniref:Phosphatidate phosphatase APP1 catalytic domain-containing protein n=1 Tax=Dactylonectria macrodidyma TaxID=307937 RepID=A0A9P9J0N0_9HYPO|nr:hypothetical protein EDB81DRAFT_652714 [Dactylonectria macrodidyma]
MLKALLLGLGPAVMAMPAPAPVAEPTVPGVMVVRMPEPTVAPDLIERDIIDDVETYVDGIISDVGSAISSLVDSGVLDFHGFPTGTQVEKTLGISDSDLDAEPTQVLNIPPYANWTHDGWNVRVHGNVYKVPNISQDKVDDLTNVFLIDTEVDDLSDSEKTQARNLTRSIFVVQQGDESVTVDFVNNFAAANGSGVVAGRGGSQKITLPYNTTDEGDFDTFVTLRNTSNSGGYLVPGNETSRVQAINLYAEGTNNNGNSTAYLVPTEGITIISDIDDILRVTKIYEPKQGLLNTFARKFIPWSTMPDIYANWSRSLPDLHFHYLTTTPEQGTRNYMEFIYKTYPLGSFDTRPLNFSDVSATLSIRRFLLDKVFQTFPERRFVLVADTSNSDVMKAYPALYKDYPGQVQCIFLRNTSATDDGDKFPYNTEGFKDIPQDRYMFFNVPDDLTNLDIANGHCYNSTIKQNVTFDYQGLPFGLSDDDSAASGHVAPRFGAIAGGVVSLLVALL